MLNENFSLNLEKCYLDSIKLVLNHGLVEDIILNHGAFLKQMAINLGGEIKTHQVDDLTPLEFPRISILTKETFINFGLNRTEIEIKGHRKHLRREQLFESYKTKIREIESLIESYIIRTELTEGFMGIVAAVRFPQNIEKSKNLLLSELYRFFTGRPNSKVVSFSTKVGINKIGKFENFEISDYEVKNINVEQNITKAITLNLENFPTVERGVMVVVDVNNKPQQSKYNFKNDFSELTTTFFEAISSFERNFI